MKLHVEYIRSIDLAVQTEEPAVPTLNSTICAVGRRGTWRTFLFCRNDTCVPLLGKHGLHDFSYNKYGGLMSIALSLFDDHFNVYT
jgi:hypothetical protein